MLCFADLIAKEGFKLSLHEEVIPLLVFFAPTTIVEVVSRRAIAFVIQAPPNTRALL